MVEQPSVVVLGLGNVLLTDDGVGIAAVHRLERDYEMAAGVQVLDGGTLGLSLLPYIERARHLLLVDAVRADGRPSGALVRIDGEEVAPAVADRLSPHQIGVADLLSGARWLARYPDAVVLLGLVPEDLGLGTERTPAVEAAIPALVEAVAAELTAIGFAPRPRTSPTPGDPTHGGPTHVARTLGL